jgi:putative SOS response-associated peptidase YedK
MCGRYAFDDIKEIYEARRILEEIASRLGKDIADSVKTGEIFPGDRAAVLAQGEGGYSADVMEWGYFLKDTKRLVINARSESAAYTGMFRRSVNQRRCLMPCTGYFEWKPDETGKVKYIIKPEGEDMFYLAGLFDYFKAGDKEVKRFVILTCEADPRIKYIHSRMPVIVTKNGVSSWFSEGYNNEKLKTFIYKTENFKAEPAAGK